MFFKDKSTMFFSMLAPLIVFVLYIVFLKDTYLSGIYNDVEPLKEFFDINDIENVANAWLLAGVLGTCTIPVALNSLQVMVVDKEKKIDYDYNSSPISGSIVVLSYFTGAFINTFLIIEYYKKRLCKTFLHFFHQKSPQKEGLKILNLIFS